VRRLGYVYLSLLASCGTPDRWNAGVSRGQGDIEGHSEKLDFDTEETRFELGISGPLGFQEKRTPPPMPAYTPAPAPAPSDGGIPLEEILLILTGAGAWAGQGYARQKYRQRRGAGA